MFFLPGHLPFFTIFTVSFHKQYIFMSTKTLKKCLLHFRNTRFLSAIQLIEQEKLVLNRQTCYAKYFHSVKIIFQLIEFKFTCIYILSIDIQQILVFSFMKNLFSMDMGKFDVIQSIDILTKQKYLPSQLWQLTH